MHRHRFDPLSFVAGVLVTAIAVVGLIGPGVLGIADLRWLAPAVLVALGLALVLGAAWRPSARERDLEPEGDRPDEHREPSGDDPARVGASTDLDGR